jgi:hypothetical protein
MVFLLVVITHFVNKICVNKGALRTSMVFVPSCVVGEVPIRACSHEQEALESMSPRVFPNLKRMHEYENLPLHKGLSFDFLASFPFRRKEVYVPTGMWGTYKIGEFP